MSRRSYHLAIYLNDIFINEIIIDPHYEAKHSESIHDGLIIELFKSLHGSFIEENEIKGDFKYFKTHWFYQGKRYRLIWLLEENQTYVGVINVFRS